MASCSECPGFIIQDCLSLQMPSGFRFARGFFQCDKQTEQADSQQHVADSGETGDGGRCPGGKQGPIDLEYAPDSKQDHRHDKTGVVENIEPVESLFRWQSRKQ